MNLIPKISGAFVIPLENTGRLTTPTPFKPLVEDTGYFRLVHDLIVPDDVFEENKIKYAEFFTESELEKVLQELSEDDNTAMDYDSKWSRRMVCESIIKIESIVKARFVIPKVVRDFASLQPGTEILLIANDFYLDFWNIDKYRQARERYLLNKSGRDGIQVHPGDLFTLSK